MACISATRVLVGAVLTMQSKNGSAVEDTVDGSRKLCGMALKVLLDNLRRQDALHDMAP